jgi:hypothetical protein
MAINFPNNPIIGQQVNSDVGTTYIWNGTVWEALTSSTNWGSFMGKVQGIDLVTAGPYQFRMAPAGNRSMQMRNIQANSTVAVSTKIIGSWGIFATSYSDKTLTKDSWSYINDAWGFSSRGQYQTLNFFDQNAFQNYRVTLTCGFNFIDNPITVEFLWQ